MKMIAATIAMLGIAIPASAQCTGDELIRQQNAAQYQRIESLNKNKGAAGLVAMRVSDCSATNPGGSHSSCADMANYTRQLIGAIGTVPSVTNTILALNLEGDRATATVAQHFVRTQTMAGQLRNIDTSAVQNETWVKTPAGWKFQSVANIHARHWYVDGKRVDPNKPFDPAAAPYNPPITADE